MTSSLHDALENENSTMLKELLKSGVDVNLKFESTVSSVHADMTPLALATALDNLNAVKMLISHGANINDTFGSLNTTVLMTSSFHGHSQIVEHLLKKGADVKLVDNQGSTALGYAFGGSRSLDVIQLLLQAGVNVNQPNLFGMTALLLVSGYGNDELVTMVLDYGANADSANHFGHTALHLAVVGKRTQLKKLFPNSINSAMYYNLNRRDIDIALKDWARRHRHISTDEFDDELKQVGQFMMKIGSTLDTGAFEGEETEEGAMKRRVEAVLKYRQEKMRLEKAKHKKRTFDGLLACGGKRAKQSARMQDLDQLPVARPLAAADVTLEGAESNKEISRLIEQYSRILHILIDAGCCIDHMEKTFGLTALDMAILLGDIESTATLVTAGGDHRHLMKTFASSELFDAIVTVDKKQVKWLLTYDVDLDVNQPLCELNDSPKMEEADQYQYERLTPLTLAAQVTDADIFDIIKLLQKHGADVNRVGPGGSSPLAESSRIGSAKMVQFLLKEGADVDLVNPFYFNATALGVAIDEQHVAVIDLLIEQGAKVDLLLSDGQSLLIKAVETYNEVIVERLLRANLQTNFCDKTGGVFQLADKFQKKIVTVQEVMISMAAAGGDEVTSFCGIGNVSGEILLSSVVPGLTSNNLAGKLQSPRGDNRSRKRRIRRPNASGAAAIDISSAAFMDSSFQSVVIDNGLQEILDISRISFKPPSVDEHRRLGGSDDLAGLGDIRLTRWPLGGPPNGASIDEELTSSSFRQGRTRRKKEVVLNRLETDLHRELVIK